MNLRNYFFTKLKPHTKWVVRYLKFARLCTGWGITPPLSASMLEQEKRWKDQEADETVVYTVHNDSVEKLFSDVLPLLNKESNILEIGCNAGRSLNYLSQKGFHHLTGIEIGEQALETFKETFPDTYNNSTVIAGNAAEEIKTLKDKAYDLVFTHSVLVNIAPKHNSIFRDMCRVCKGYILILEAEGSWTSFPRNFKKMLEKQGFKQVAYRLMVWDQDEQKLIFPLKVTKQHLLKNNTIRLFAAKDGI